MCQIIPSSTPTRIIGMHLLPKMSSNSKPPPASSPVSISITSDLFRRTCQTVEAQTIFKHSIVARLVADTTQLRRIAISRISCIIAQTLPCVTRRVSFPAVTKSTVSTSSRRETIPVHPLRRTPCTTLFVSPSWVLRRSPKKTVGSKLKLSCIPVDCVTALHRATCIN